MLTFSLWLMLILPWCTLFFIDTFQLKRFIPVALLGTILVMLIFELGYVYEFWHIKKSIVRWGHITGIPLTFGPFFIGTIWIFALTYDRGFLFYIITNAIVDAAYPFIGLSVLIFLGVYEMVNVNQFGIFLIMIALAVIIYPFQKWIQSVMKESNDM